MQILFLRHGEVASHRGDVPVTQAGLLHAEQSGKAIAASFADPVTVFYGGTRRTRETAEAIIRGMDAFERVAGPIDSFALRNPDMYAAGTRVNMVSSPESLAEQVPGMTATQAAANAWWDTFFHAPDRIGWWLGQDDPPGETRDDVSARLQRFARTFADPGPYTGRLVVCVTHSPLLRSLAIGAGLPDPGELDYVTGSRVTVSDDGRLDVATFAPLT